MIPKLISKTKYTVDQAIQAIKEWFSLSDKGERVDIVYNEHFDFDKFDMYEKSHFRRYEFAVQNMNNKKTVGDFACGTGYGTVMLKSKSEHVIGADINEKVINKIKRRYKDHPNLEFIALNLLDLPFENRFDSIVSFETIEHLYENDIPKVLAKFNRALKPKGIIIFSTPFMQERSEAAVKMGFHLTFDINENKINAWLKNTNFTPITYKYQNYKTHEVSSELKEKDFIICIAQKIEQI